MTDQHRTNDTDAAATEWREVVWMGMRFRTPSDWEIVSHSTRLARGRLVLIDRRRQRLQLSWAHCDSRPDLKRAISDYRDRDRQDDPDCTFANLAGQAGWRGFARSGESDDLTRAGRYLHKRNLWVEMTIAWPAGRDANVERRVLDSFKTVAAPSPTVIEADDVEAMSPTHWRVFGLDIVAPAGWALTAATVKPADVAIEFAAAWDPYRTATVRRLGMIDSWFKGDARGFLQKQAGYDVECRFHSGMWSNFTAALAVSVEPATRFKRLTGRGRTRRDIAWVDERAHALLCATTWSRDADPVEPDEFEIHGYLLR